MESNISEQNFAKMTELDKYEFFLQDEKERLAKCEDEYTVGLLANRIKMYENIIKELKSKEQLPCQS